MTKQKPITGSACSVMRRPCCFSAAMRRAVTHAHSRPLINTPACKNGTIDMRYGCHAIWAVPKRFQPAPKGSLKVGHRYDRLANTNARLNAIHAMSPNGTSAYAKAMKDFFNVSFDFDTARPSATAIKNVPGRIT